MEVHLLRDTFITFVRLVLVLVLQSHVQGLDNPP